MSLQYPRYHWTNPMFLFVDNSDSPSVVEQSQQGCGSSCYTLLAVIPSSVKCPMPYMSASLLHMGISCCASLSLISVSLCSPCSSLPQLLLFGTLQPLFYPVHFLIEPWDSLSDYVHPGIACLAFLGLQLDRCILG